MTHCMTLASYKLIFLNIHKLHCLITKRALQVIDNQRGWGDPLTLYYISSFFVKRESWISPPRKLTVRFWSIISDSLCALGRTSGPCRFCSAQLRKWGITISIDWQQNIWNLRGLNIQFSWSRYLGAILAPLPAPTNFLNYPITSATVKPFG